MSEHVRACGTEKLTFRCDLCQLEKVAPIAWVRASCHQGDTYLDFCGVCYCAIQGSDFDGIEINLLRPQVEIENHGF